MGVSLLEGREINQPFTMKMKGLAVLVLAIGITEAQLKFGGGSSSSSSSSGSQDTSTDTRFISSGNELIDGGILGVGAGLLGGAVLSGALNGGGNNNYNSNYNNPCGRRKRQADGDDSNTRIFGLFGGGNNNGCNCGRRKRRQAPGEDEVGVRFFGLENLLGGGGGNNCGCNCGYNQYPSNSYPSNNYPSNNYPSNNYPSNNGQNSCQCNYQLTFQDKYGNTHGACRRPDETGRTWCYTTGGWGCSDARQSQRFPNNPWSYQACSFSG